MADAEISNGILVYRASRLEALLDPLLALCQAVPASSAHLLVKQTVLVAHAGMRQWLATAIARKRAATQGDAAIVADLDLVLPSAWMDGLAKSVLGQSAVAIEPYRKDVLRWRIFAALGGDAAALNLHDDVRRMQLADRLAHLYNQYIVYRPDWLAAWERGDDVPGVNAGFVGPLWATVRRGIDSPYRAQVQKELIRKIAAGASTYSPGQDADAVVHVFGVNHLPRGDLELLQAIATRRVVVMYVPDPSSQRWQEVSASQRAMMRLDRDTDLGEAEREALELDLLDTAHPLIAKWGRLGQHYFARLEGIDARFDTRHSRDPEQAAFAPDGAAEDGPMTRLVAVQESIRRFDPPLLAAETAADDRSLLVHQCHTRLRELEVLKQEILEALARDASLSPGDFLVTAPNIAEYAPLIPSVFSALPDHPNLLPHQMRDVPSTRTDELVELFGTLLGLPMRRMDTEVLLGILRHRAVRRAFHFGEGDLPAMREFLETNRVAWGFDAADRERWNVPALHEHTLAWGIDRAVTAHLVGATRAIDASAPIVDGVMSAQMRGVIDAGSWTWMGELDRLLTRLHAFCRLALGDARPLTEWSDHLLALLNDGIAVEPDDETANQTVEALRNAVIGLREQAEHSGTEPVVDYACVHAATVAALAGVQGRERGALGGIVFSGMVPQRAIPYEFVAVLGLNDGEFPRLEIDDGLDLMLKNPRVGDRDVLTDDRYLFLETVMSARRQLHLSYVAESAIDGKMRNSAVPLDDLMNALAPSKRWLVKHPLQPFDARYFGAPSDNPAGLISYDVPPRESAPGTSAQPAPRVAVANAIASLPQGIEPIAISRLRRYFTDPARYTAIHTGERVDLFSAENLRGIGDEPLEGGFDPRLRMAWKLFEQHWLAGTVPDPETVPDWMAASGLTARGELLKSTWRQTASLVRDALVSGAVPVDEGMAKHTVSIDVRSTSVPLTGEVQLYRDRQGGLHVPVAAFEKSAKGQLSALNIGFRELLQAFIAWSAVRLATAEARKPVSVYTVSEAGNSRWAAALNDWDARFCEGQEDGQLEALADALSRLLDYFRLATAERTHRDRIYFARTSWVAFRDGDPEKIQAQWAGGDYQRGEIDYSVHNRSAGADLDFSPASPELAALTGDARWLGETLDFAGAWQAELAS